MALKLVVTNGTFDLLRRGHRECLKAAKALAPKTHLVVLVNSDWSVQINKGRWPVNPLEVRIKQLFDSGLVDDVRVFHEKSPREMIAEIKPDFYVKGGDYTLETIDPRTRQICEENGTKIVFIPRTHNFSTTRIIRRLQRWGYFPDIDLGKT